MTRDKPCVSCYFIHKCPSWQKFLTKWFRCKWFRRNFVSRLAVRTFYKGLRSTFLDGAFPPQSSIKKQWRNEKAFVYRCRLNEKDVVCWLNVSGTWHCPKCGVEVCMTDIDGNWQGDKFQYCPSCSVGLKPPDNGEVKV